MDKILVGLLLGLILGAIDGASAWSYPEARSMMASILVGSSVKGMIVGVLTGWFARRVRSTGWGIIVGATLGLLFAFFVAAMEDATGQHHYLEIMLPGFVVGAIIGFLTQRVGKAGPVQKARL